MKREVKLKVMAETKEDKELWQEVREIRQEVNSLRKEMYQEFENIRKEMYEEFKQLRDEIHRLDKKFTVLILIVIFLIIFLNQNALEFFFKVLGLIK